MWGLKCRPKVGLPGQLGLLGLLLVPRRQRPLKNLLKLRRAGKNLLPLFRRPPLNRLAAQFRGPSSLVTAGLLPRRFTLVFGTFIPANFA